VPVGGQIREPRRLTYVPPVYPVVAQAARVEGIVILEAIIDETGAVRDVRVLRSIPLLDRAAIDAVSRWRYLPTTLNGVAVPVIMTVTVSFKLLGSGLVLRHFSSVDKHVLQSSRAPKNVAIQDLTP
jgi:TonB family protein